MNNACMSLLQPYNREPDVPGRKLHFAVALSALMLLGFIATSVTTYFAAHESLSSRITGESLPLTSDNIYSGIERDLLRPILVTSMMAHNSFIVDWLRDGEDDISRITAYLDAIRSRYDTSSAFLVSEATRRYYGPEGILRQVDPDDPADAWYFRVREMAHSHEIHVDPVANDSSRVGIYINHRVVDDGGNFLGAIGTALSIESVTERIDAYQRRYDREIFLVSREGDIMLHGSAFDGTRDLHDHMGKAGHASKVLSTPGASFRYPAPNSGATIYVNSRLIPELDAFLVVQQAETAAELRIVNALLLNVAIAIVFALLVLTAGWFAFRGYQTRIAAMAATDSLTGAVNREVFELMFNQAAKRAARNDAPLSMIMVDVDNLAGINHEYGYLAGDAVLGMVAGAIRAHVRESDAVCRWADDAFLILLGECNEEDAGRVAEKIRDAVERRVVHHDDREFRITVSVGFARQRPQECINVLADRCNARLFVSRQRRNGQ